MFGDLGDMMSKLKDTQKEIEVTKKRLNTVLIDESGADNKLKITVTANSQIKAITISEELLKDKEELEDYLIITLNKALNNATKIHEQEMSAVTKNNMPNIPGMDMFK